MKGIKSKLKEIVAMLASLVSKMVSTVMRVPKRVESKDEYLFGMYGRLPMAYGIKDYPYEKLKKMGIGAVYTHVTEKEGIEASLMRAKEAGVKVFFDGYWDLIYRQNVNKTKKEIIDKYPESFGGSFVVDEPYLERTEKGFEYKYLPDTEVLTKALKEGYPNATHFVTAYCNYATVGQLLRGKAQKGEKYPTEEEYYDYISKIAKGNTDVVMACNYSYGVDWMEERWPMQMKVLQEVSKETNKPLWVWSLASQHGSFKAYDQKDFLYTILYNMMWGVQSIWFYLYGNYSYGRTKYTNAPFDHDQVTKTGELLSELLNGICKNYGSLFENAEMKSVDIWQGATKEEHPKGVKEIHNGTALVNNFKKDGHEYVGVFAVSDVEVKMYPAYRFVVESDMTITRGRIRLNNTFSLKKGDIKIFWVR